ncbi:hypothetical protein OF83DRAFT_1024821, partial [Amylostereum chailletii]
GIISVCCTRHGCWYPHSCADLQKGEQYVGVCTSGPLLSNHGCWQIECVLMLYDIMCQYSVYFMEQFMCNPDELTLPKFKEILKGIGKWHIQGHVDTCLPKFSPLFIWGIGNIDSEIVETLWSLLNLIAHSGHQMTLPSRAELIDAHMNDNNYKKMIGMGE